jgi:hypothetical protein
MTAIPSSMPGDPGRAAHRAPVQPDHPRPHRRTPRHPQHAIAQRAILDPLTPTQTDQLIRVAADALDQAWPAVENDPALSQTLRTNTTTLAGHDTRHTLWAWDDGGAHPLLSRPTSSLGETGALTERRPPPRPSTNKPSTTWAPTTPTP